MSGSEPSVVVENLTKRFGAFVAVDSINFQAHRGEIFGFLGPNGAGKSTTIRILCGSGIIPRFFTIAYAPSANVTVSRHSGTLPRFSVVW